MPLVVNCEWGECAQEFDSMAPFSSHITDHLQQVLREAPGGHNEEEEEEDDEYNGGLENQTYKAQNNSEI